MRFIDTHVHFDDFVREGELEALLNRAQEAQVVKLLSIGGSEAANALSLLLAEEYPGRIFGCVGYDRDLAMASPDLLGLAQYAVNPLVKAIGEAGLDYYYVPESAPQQRLLFSENLALAAKVQKPIVVHTREADDDTLALLREYAAVWKGREGMLGVVHCFTRDRAFAEQVLDLGFMISFSGIVTFNNAAVLREVAGFVPDDRLLIETDSPYLAPVPLRGRRNEPSFVVHVAKQLAELRGCSLELLAVSTSKNATALFSI
jgi:TatD DNase family protein